MIRVLIVGSGDVARRMLPIFVNRFSVFALVRDPAKAAWWRDHGVRPVMGDLDRPSSLTRLRGLAHWILHFAPPGEVATHSAAKFGTLHIDTRTRHLLAALTGPTSLPQRLVYISTSGVYGDCGGARIDETRRTAPATARAWRRIDAENVLRRWAIRTGVRLVILRVPGIYAEDRLPLNRLIKRTPVLTSSDDVFTNHVHADDLARIAWLAVRRGRSNRVYNATDDSEIRMADYFDRIADAFGIERPPRIARVDAEHEIPASLMSFMSESRRLVNSRMKKELGVRLEWPHVDQAVEGMARHRHAKGCESQC